MYAFCVVYTSCLWLSQTFCSPDDVVQLSYIDGSPTHKCTILFYFSCWPTDVREVIPISYSPLQYIIGRPSTAAAAAVHQLCNKTAMHTHYYVYIQRMCFVCACVYFFFFISFGFAMFFTHTMYISVYIYYISPTFLDLLALHWDPEVLQWS